MKLAIKQIKDTLNNNRDYIRDTYHVVNIGIFGSVARGENTEKSDLDVLVEFSKPIGFFEFVRLEDYLTKVIGQRVDLVTKNALRPFLKEEILSQTIYV